MKKIMLCGMLVLSSSVFAKNTRVTAIEDVFRNIKINSSASTLPKNFTQISQSEYAAFIDDFPITIIVENGRVKHIKTQLRFSYPDKSYYSKWQELRLSLFYDNRTPKPYSDSDTKASSSKTEYRRNPTRYCYGQEPAYSSVSIEFPKKVFMHMAYSGGRAAYKCDSSSEAERSGYGSMLSPEDGLFKIEKGQ